MKNVIIIGAGGHSAEIDEYIEYTRQCTGVRQIRIIGFLDDNPDTYTAYKFSAPFLGRVKDHKVSKEYNYIMGIANLKHRRLIIEKYLDAGAEFLSFIHCTAYVSPTAEIGNGCILGPNVNIGPNVKIGKFNLINSRCSLGHDTVLGDFNFISPNVCFSGFTKIGNENLFGINSATIPELKVGDHNKIAAGMILNKNIASNTVVFHRFKEKIIAVNKS